MMTTRFFNNEEYLGFMHTSMEECVFDFRFPNGYSGNVARNKRTCGGPDGLWEVAVMYNDKIVYDTEITDDVVGYLTEEEVEDVLCQIRKLPRRRTGFFNNDEYLVSIHNTKEGREFRFNFPNGCTATVVRHHSWNRENPDRFYEVTFTYDDNEVKEDDDPLREKLKKYLPKLPSGNIKDLSEEDAEYVLCQIRKLPEKKR